MEIQINKDVVLVKEEKFTASKINVLVVQHYPTLIEAQIELTDGVKSQEMTITLWDGKDYKTLGTYSNQDVENRLLELLG